VQRQPRWPIGIMGLHASEASLTYARCASHWDMLTFIHKLILVLMLTSMHFGASGMHWQA
jgi:hypothetical protein